METDNEKRRRFDALTPVEVSIEEVTLIPNGKGFATRIFDWISSKNVLGRYVNADKGWAIEVSKNSVRSVVAHEGNIKKIALLAVVPSLINSGFFLETIPKNKYGLKTHVFAGKANIGGAIYAVGFAVREDTNGKRYYDHSLTKIEELAPNNEPTGVPQKRVSVSNVRPEGEAVGELSLHNILKKHLGVNSKAKKHSTSSGEADAAPSPPPADGAG